MQSLHRVSAGDLQRFLDAPEELLGESRGIQIAVASFAETPTNISKTSEDEDDILEPNRTQ